MGKFPVFPGIADAFDITKECLSSMSRSLSDGLVFLGHSSALHVQHLRKLSPRFSPIFPVGISWCWEDGIAGVKPAVQLELRGGGKMCDYSSYTYTEIEL